MPLQRKYIFTQFVARNFTIASIEGRMFQLSDTQGFFKVNNNFREQERGFNRSAAR